jgi:hypothetical protein
MKTLNSETTNLIKLELESIPEKYWKDFNSTHEGLGVLREEYLELEKEIFFGEKEAKKEFPNTYEQIHKERIRKEAIQVAAMAVRIIQELT